MMPDDQSQTEVQVLQHSSALTEGDGMLPAEQSAGAGTAGARRVG